MRGRIPCGLTLAMHTIVIRNAILQGLSYSTGVASEVTTVTNILDVLPPGPTSGDFFVVDFDRINPIPAQPTSTPGGSLTFNGFPPGGVEPQVAW